MAGDVRRVVRKCTERESVFVDVLAFAQKFEDKVAAANIMHQVAELPAAEGIVAEVLDNRATVGVSMRFADLIVRESGVTGQQERPDLVGPEQIDNLFVGENRVRMR